MLFFRMKRDTTTLESIDIVIPWVDPEDEAWLNERKLYAKEESASSDGREIRFRDWDNLQYLFRGIETYAPWIRKVHFVTYGHLPKWLNVNHPKLHIVNHKDYIPMEYLPTFSSHVIELNMHRIEGLSDRFVYFNDDIFIINELKETDFFHGNLPCDALSSTPIMPRDTGFWPILFNTVKYINKHFDKSFSMKHRPLQWFNPAYRLDYMIRSMLFSPWSEYIGFATHHLAMPYAKSTLETVWNEESDILDETCRRRFRDNRDVNQYIFRYWQLASGSFYPHKILGKYFTNDTEATCPVDYILKKAGKLVCINDNNPDCDFEDYKMKINNALDAILPRKSEYEL